MAALSPPLIRGDTEAIDFTVTNPDGSPRNIGTDDFVFTAKVKKNDPVPYLQKTIDGGGIVRTNAAAGKAQVLIAAADFLSMQKDGNFECEIKGTTAGGSVKVYTDLFQIKVIMRVS